MPHDPTVHLGWVLHRQEPASHQFKASQSVRAKDKRKGNRQRPTARKTGHSGRPQPCEASQNKGPQQPNSTHPHAMYPIPGSWSLPSGVPLLKDHADGEGHVDVPWFEELHPAEEPWISWPGHWGGTNPGSIPGEAESPPGPMYHPQWNDPKAFSEEALECFENYDFPELARGAASGSGNGEGIEHHAAESVEILAARQNGQWFDVRYRLHHHDSDLRKVNLTVYDEDERAVASKIVETTQWRGRARIPNILRVHGQTRLRASVMNSDGERSAVVEVPIELGGNEK